ncbi:MAG: MFS transporter [Candidatus Rokuibacteriota bacterium]
MAPRSPSASPPWRRSSARVMAGLFVDRVDRRLASACNFALQAAAVTLMTGSSSVPTLYVASVAFGLGVGNVVTFPALIVQTEYPREHFNRIVSLIVAINQFTFAFGPGALGWARDWWGSYSAALVLCAACEIVALVVVSSTSSLLGRYLSRPSRPAPCR